MSENLISILILIAPIAFALTAFISKFQPGSKPQKVVWASKMATGISIPIALLGGVLVIKYGLIESTTIGFKNFGFSLRLDELSVLMMTMISLLSFVIIKFSHNYMDGDQRQGAFLGRLALTIASVYLFVLSGNLGVLFISWVLTSVSLHRLLIFYHERPRARVTAKKKFLLARMADFSLLAAFLLLYTHFGTGNLEEIISTIKAKQLGKLPFMALEGPAIFIVIAALLKSAQFPTHGWLIEVMETPTPVSALLHAGLLNAGPFLIIRMAYIIEGSSIAPLLLMIFGGFTALFASVSYLTQTSVKTALGYSSIAHMGFSLMVCGFGVYSAAMLHLVAHSFYKAHAFLSSGSNIEVIKGAKMKRIEQSFHPLKLALGLVLALVIFSVSVLIWGIDPEKEIFLLIIGAVIVLGIVRLMTYALDFKGNFKLTIQLSLMAILVTISFFSLESGTHYLLSSQLPEMALPGSGRIFTSVLILVVFSVVVLIQILSPALSKKTYYQKMSIHLRNGFYANVVFDRMVGALQFRPKHTQKIIRESAVEITENQSSEVPELDEQFA